MSNHFSPDGEKNWQAEQRRLDLEVKNRWRTFNTEVEIAIHRDEPDEDPVRTRMSVLLEKASGTLDHAMRNKYGYSDVCDLADEALKLRPTSADAISLRADALALRGTARAGLRLFAEAADDATAAIALSSDAGASYGASARRLLQMLRGEM